MWNKKIEYLKITSQTLESEGLLGNIVLRQWQVIVELIEQTGSFSFNKATLIEKTGEKISSVTPESFRKSISMLNQEFKESNLGIKIDNSEDIIVITINNEKVTESTSQETADFIRQYNQHSEINDENFISPKASVKPVESKRQVFFSYAWGSSEAEKMQQNRFARYLSEGLKFPPARFKDHEKITLFRDEDGFRLGESQQKQQDEACEVTPFAIICYTNKYLHSKACQKEVDFYLQENGNNQPYRKAIVIPFSIGFCDLDKRYQENLAHTANDKFRNALDLFESGREADKQEFVEPLVDEIYTWFYENPNLFDKHYDVKNTLRDTGSSVDSPFPNPEDLRGSTQQLQYEDAIDIVDFMYDWANGTTGMETRLFYLLGDFGSGKSTSCQMLTKKLMDNYNSQTVRSCPQESPPVMPIYLDLKKLLNAFSNQKDIAIQPINALLETMLSSTGVTNNVSGDSIIHFIKEYPCLLIFDGFDEVGQKINESQQNGLLNKLLNIFPNSVYQKDLERLDKKENQQTSSAVPINSRILISCRTHFFSNYAEQDSFHQINYRHRPGVSLGGIRNYQTYYLLPFTKEQIENYLINCLGKAKANKALAFINNVHDLSGLSERPIMLNLIHGLLPELQREFEENSYINASTLYRLLFDKVGYRDKGKHLIPLDEKRKMLGRFALHLWQKGLTNLNVEALDDWFIEHRNDYPKLSIKIDYGQYEPELMLQDLHNASLLVRDNNDKYSFAHTSFFEFFVALGIFDTVSYCDHTKQGFDFIFNRDNLSKEIIQFLLDWRLYNNDTERDRFDEKWQLLQQADSSISARQIAFDIWYFTYNEQQQFTRIAKPNWQNLKLFKLRIDRQQKNNILDLSGVNLSGASIEECDFSFTDLSKVNLRESIIRQCVFEECKFDPTHFKTHIFYGNKIYGSSIILKDINCKPENYNNMLLSRNTNNEVLKNGRLEVQALNSLNIFNKNIIEERIEVSNDFKNLAIQQDNKIVIWDCNRNYKIKEFYTNELCVFKYSPCGEFFALGTLKYLKIYSVINGYYECKFSLDLPVMIIDFSEDSKLIAICDGTKVFVIRLSDYQIINEYDYRIMQPKDVEAYYHHIKDIIFGKDDLFIITYKKITKVNKESYPNNISLILEYADRKILYFSSYNLLVSIESSKMYFINADTLSLEYSMDTGVLIENIEIKNDILYVGAMNVLYEWEHENKNLLEIFKGSISNFRLSGTGDFLVASTNISGEIRLWDILNKRCIYVIPRMNFVKYIELIDNGRKIISCSEDNLSLWDTEKKSRIELYKYDSFLLKYDYSDTLKTIILSEHDGLRTINLTTNESNFYKLNYKKLSLGSNGTKVALIRYGSVRIFNLKTKKFEGIINKIGFSRETIYHPTQDIIYIQDTQTRLRVFKFDGLKYYLDNRMIFNETPRRIIISPSGSFLVILGKESEITIISTESLEEVYRYKNSLFSRNIQFDVVNDYLCFFSFQTLTIINIFNGENYFDFESPEIIETVSFSIDNDLLAIGCSKNRTLLYRMSNKELLCSYQSCTEFWGSFNDIEHKTPVKIGGKAWKYLINIVDDGDNKLLALSPDTHPEWHSSYT